jgi:hypothetical protein
MNKLSETIASGLIHAYRDFARRVRALAERLSEEQFWTKPYPYGNSFGHLTLHLTGNLNYYIGAQLVGTGYVRDREREFTEQAPPSKEEALRRFDEAVEMVLATLERQTAESWSEGYSAAGASDVAKDRFSIFLSCAAHLHHHVGQMIYLEKEFSK